MERGEAQVSIPEGIVEMVVTLSYLRLTGLRMR